MIARTIPSSMTFLTATEMLKNGLLPASCSRLMSQQQKNFYRRWLRDNSQNSGRQRTKSLTCVNIRNSLQLFRQVLRWWTVKAAVGEYRQPKRDTISNPQPVKILQQWADAIASTGSMYQSCSGVLNRLKLVDQLLWQTKKHCATVVETWQH